MLKPFRDLGHDLMLVMPTHPLPAAPTAASVGAASTISMLVNWQSWAWYSSGIMLGALLVAMTIDLVTAYFAVSPEARRTYLWERQITRKFVLLLLVVLSLVLDFVMYAVADALPHEIPILENGYLFFTLTTLLWLIAAETARIIINVGEDAPPTLGLLVQQIQWVVRSLRKIDSKRWQDSGRDGAPPQRWMDDLSEQEVAKIVKMLDEHRASEEDIARNPQKLVKRGKK